MLVVRRCKLSQSRLCPVCEKEIPINDYYAQSYYLCPHCWSDLKKTSNEDYIDNRRRTLEQDSETKTDMNREIPKWYWVKYYLAGFLTCLVLGFLIGNFFRKNFLILMATPKPFTFLDFIVVSGLCLPFGLIAGCIGGRLEKKFPNPSNQVWFIFFTVILVPILIAGAIALLFVT